MKRIILFFCILFTLSIWSQLAYSQDLEVYTSFESFEPLLNQNNDTLYIINFWATWCKPCVMELPHFQKINQEFEEQKIRMILVNLDFGHDYQERVREFITSKDLRPEVVILDDTDGNKWIPKVCDEWTGSIPATVIYGRGYRYFFQEMLDYEQLKELVTKHLNN